MAISEDIRLKIQAVYESNNLSVRKIYERFAGIPELKEKTIESWVKKYGWVKNRFQSEAQAIEELVDISLPLDKAKDIIKESLQKEIVDGKVVDKKPLTEEQKDKYAKEVSREITYQVLNIQSLQSEMALNLNRSKVFAENAKTIGSVKTHHDMLIATYQTIHGKNINIAPQDPNSKVLSDKDLEYASIDELKRLIG